MEQSEHFLKILDEENERLTEQLGSMIRDYRTTNKNVCLDTKAYINSIRRRCEMKEEQK